jgi:hypothetical protein
MSMGIDRYACAFTEELTRRYFQERLARLEWDLLGLASRGANVRE